MPMFYTGTSILITTMGIWNLSKKLWKGSSMTTVLGLKVSGQDIGMTIHLHLGEVDPIQSLLNE